MLRNPANTNRQRKMHASGISFVLVLILLSGASLSCRRSNSASENPDSNENEAAEVASPSPTASPEETPEPAVSFQGNWVNRNPATAGLTRLRITQNDSEVKVRAFGKCTPSDCDWGEESGGIIDNSAILTWDQGFVIRKMTLALQGNELRCVLESVYNDNRPRQRSEEVFVKQS